MPTPTEKAIEAREKKTQSLSKVAAAAKSKKPK